MRFWGPIFALGAVLNIAVGWHEWPAIAAGNFADTDSYMRLVRIQQSLREGKLLNMVAGDQSGAGVLLEWSHLFDMILIAMAAPMAAILGWKSALFAAGIASGPLSVGFLGVALAYVARPISEDLLLWTAPVAAALSPDILTVAPFGGVHDSALTLAFAAISAGCIIRAWRGGTGHAFLGGVAGGAAVWLTPEILLLVLIGFLPLLVRWLQKPMGAVIAACTAGFFDVIGFAFAIDPAKGGYFVTDTHRLSLAYAVLAVLLLLAGTTIWRLQDSPRARWRRSAGIAAIVAALGVWAVGFPEVLRGGIALLQPDDPNLPPGFDALSDFISRPAMAIKCLGAGGLATVYIFWRAISDRSWHWLFAGLICLVTIALGFRLTLFAAASAAIAAALLPAFLSVLNRQLRPVPAAALAARVACLLALVTFPYLPALAENSERTPSFPPLSCSLHNVNTLLRNEPRQIVLAMPNATPELLYRTKSETVGSLYPNGITGFLRARAAWRAPPGDQAPDAFRATGAKYVLFCPLAPRDSMIGDVPSGSLWDALHAGTIPPWLVLQAQDSLSSWQLFETR